MTAQRPPAWPELERRLRREGSRAEILPVASDSPTAERLGVAEWSTLGAIARHTGGLLLADGWIRVFGGVGAADAAGGPRLPSLDEVNPAGAEHFVVAADVLGGVFALDGGAFGRGDGQLHYFAPDTLDWDGLAIGLTAFLEAMTDGADAEFFEDVRWRGWEAEVITLGLDEGISIYPFLCTRESKPLERASRSAVPLDELVDSHVELVTQVEGRAPSPVPSVRAVPRPSE